MPSQTSETTSRPLLPLPRFRQPTPAITDDDLPEVIADDPAPAMEPAPLDLPPASPPSERRPPLPDLSPEAPTRTPISSRAGDPKVAGEVIAGLVALLCGIAAGLLGRRRMHLRQPTPDQVDAMAQPAGRLLARHLPTEVISRDLVDATAAAGAVHRYLTDGPLVERIPEPIPSIGDEQ